MVLIMDSPFLGDLNKVRRRSLVRPCSVCLDDRQFPPPEGLQRAPTSLDGSCAAKVKLGLGAEAWLSGLFGRRYLGLDFPVLVAGNLAAGVTLVEAIDCVLARRPVIFPVRAVGVAPVAQRAEHEDEETEP